MSKPTDIFIRYYDEQFWGNQSGSSGPNSAFELTPMLRSNLQDLFDTLQPSSILDLGCGDATLFRHLNLTDCHYTGVECVPKLTTLNQKQFADQTHMHFCTADVTVDPLPDAELLICRDVVHYLPNEAIWQLLKNICKTSFKYLLITHNTHSAQSANSPTEVGIFRPVNLMQQPFHLPTPMQTLKEDVFAKEMALWDKSAVVKIL